MPAAAAFEWDGLQPIGDVQAVSRTQRGVALTCTDGSAVALSVLAPDLVRVRTVFAGQSAGHDHSWAVAKTDWEPTPWTLAETATDLTITTAELEVVIHRHPLLVEFRDAGTHQRINADERPMARDSRTGRVAVGKRLGFDEHFYGLGEKAAHLDRRRGEFTMWNSDTPGYIEGTDPIYQSIPFYIGWEEGAAYGLFYDNSRRTTFDLGHSGQDRAGYLAEGGLLDYYFFRGPSIRKVLGRYTELTGRMPMPPRWALGNQQSRYSYYPDSVVRKVAETYRAHDLPLDVLYLDIDYMNGYRVFTWDPQRFPDPARLTGDLAKLGIKVVTIVDPGVKYQPMAGAAPAERADPGIGEQEGSYYVYNQGVAHDYFLRRSDGRLYVGKVWPGKAVFVDYTRADAREWWGGLFRALLDKGVAGIWTDMNEPSDFVDKSGESQKDVVFDDLGARSSYGQNRNVFALNMARATFEGLQRLQPDRRPFVITRAGYAGVQRYSTMWTGDNNATFESLALNVPMFESLGLSGETFVGSDLPGFIGRGSGELLARGYEIAFLVPLCRNHGAIDDYDHEPWQYGAPYEAIVRKYLQLRYRLMPYLYTTIEEAHRTGVPLFRPLLLNFQEDRSNLNLDDEFMVGDALLAAPITQSGQRAREVYLPDARFYDFWTGGVVEGRGELVHAEAPLDHLPLYVRGGSVLPSTIAMSFTDEKPWSPLRWDVYPDRSGAAVGTLFEDDGASPDEGRPVRRTTVRLIRATTGSTLSVAPEGSFNPGVRNLEITLHDAAVSAVTLDGRPLDRVSGEAGGPGWYSAGEASIGVRLADDGRPHSIHFQ